MKKTKRLNRGLALFLALMMSLMPVTVFAGEEPSGEGGTQILENEAAPPPISKNLDGITGESNQPANDPVAAVQALIDKLPDPVTADNAEEVAKKLDEINAVKADLTDEQIKQLNIVALYCGD